MTEAEQPFGPGHPHWPTIEDQERIAASLANRPERERFLHERGWPDDVWTIGVNRLDLLGVDDAGNLYWNGKAVEYRKSIVLTVWQRIGAIVLAASAIIGACSAAVSAYADWRAIEARPAESSRAR